MRSIRCNPKRRCAPHSKALRARGEFKTRSAPAWWASALTCLLLCAHSVAAQDGVDRRNETWPEVQLLIRTSEKTRLFLNANISQERESRANREGQLGAHFDYLATDHVWFRAGYRYGRSLNSDSNFREHRLLLEQTFKTTLPGKIQVSDRNRQDFRFVRGDYSFRYRNRLTLEREIGRGEYRFTPYVQGEIYFDSRFDAWSRHRYGGGVVFPFSKLARATPSKPRFRDHVSLDLYAMRQSDSQPSPARANAFGASLIFSF
jgi:hypothetical protein